jgi:hypothetical protein
VLRKELEEEDIKDLYELATIIKDYCVKVEVNQHNAETIYEIDGCSRTIIEILSVPEGTIERMF